VECLNCIFIRYIELRLSINMYVGSMFVLASFIVSCMAVNSARRMFCNPSSLYVNLIFFLYYICHSLQYH
jgi:hypothetical protein